MAGTDEILAGTGITPDEICTRAGANLNAMVYGTIALLQRQGRSVTAWAEGLGSEFAEGWEDVQGQGARAALREFAVNALCQGGTLVRFDGDDRRAEAVIEGWFQTDLLDFVGIDEAAIEEYLAIFRPIARYLGLHYGWQRQDQTLIVTFQQI